MQNSQDNYLRFVSLKLKDYKIFRGVNEFRFNRHRTLIVGMGGVGKTIIADVLEYLGHPPKREEERLINRECNLASVAVITEGDAGLLNRYRSLMFIDCEDAQWWAMDNKKFQSRNRISNKTWKEVTRRARVIFNKIISDKPWKINLHRDLNAGVMAADEKICLGYAFIFALRATLKLDIPIVFDSPFGRLDEYLRKGLSDFLKAQPCQQILLGCEREFSKEESPAYAIVHAENYSHVMEY